MLFSVESDVLLSRTILPRTLLAILSQTGYYGSNGASHFG